MPVRLGLETFVEPVWPDALRIIYYPHLLGSSALVLRYYEQTALQIIRGFSQVTLGRQQPQPEMARAEGGFR